MAKPDDQLEEGSEPRWKGLLAAGLLIFVGVLHAAKPAWLALDWPSVTLVLVGVLLLFVPLNNLGALIESVEFGKNKILFRKTKELQTEVKAALRSENIETLSKNIAGVYVGTHRTHDSATGRTPPEDADLERRKDMNPQVPGMGGLSFFDETRIRALLDVDKDMALIRVAIEIERMTNILAERNGITVPGSKLSLNQVIPKLVQAGEITAQASRALMQFQRVRNEIVHAGREVSEQLITSAISSGWDLLSLLRSKLYSEGLAEDASPLS